MSFKDPNCPNCGGRSFSMTDDSGYVTCNLCERPTEEFHAWYRSKWPEVYEAWKSQQVGSGPDGRNR